MRYAVYYRRRHGVLFYWLSKSHATEGLIPQSVEAGNAADAIAAARIVIEQQLGHGFHAGVLAWPIGSAKPSNEYHSPQLTAHT